MNTINLLEMSRDILFNGCIKRYNIDWAKGKVIEHTDNGNVEYFMYLDASGIYIHKYGGRYYLDEYNSNIL